MGLLDDAIREHLELKRRRGADPDEVSRQESEALGPVRREEPAAEAAPEAAAGGAVAAPVEEPALDEPAAAYADEPVEPAPPRYEEPVAPPPPPAPAEAQAPPPPPPPAPEPEPAPDPQATQAFSAEEVARAAGDRVAPDEEGEGEDGDVLDQTPDFLQETPEHDRLWFEQKPPKDFDF